MASFCIPKIQANKLINALKGDTLSKLSLMTSKERRDFFEKQIGKEMSRKVNASFEKALAANTKSAMKKFAENVVGKSSDKKDIISRINKLDENKLLEGNILEDHISEVLGANITEKEAAEVLRIGKATNKAKQTMETEFANLQSKGKITKEYTDSLVEYAKMLKETDEFLLKNAPNDFSSTVYNHAKATMLLNPASWNVNIVSNLLNAGITGIERRVKNLKLSGYSSDLAQEWKKTMLKVRKETGYDLSRALSMDDLMQKKISGEKMSIGKDSALTRFVYEGALGRPDAWAGRLAFADALDLETTSLVKGMGLKGNEAKEKAREIFLDAIQVVPKTEEGKLARMEAVQEAQIATWTQKGAISSNTLKLKELLNKFAEAPIPKGLGIKGFKVGDLIEPFVKTPANIAAYGLDASGVGIIRGAGKFVSLLKNHSQLTRIQRRKLLGEALRDSMRTGLGVGGALVLASYIDKDNFVGAYDPNRYKYEQLRNSNSNSIRIGDKWYSLDYAGGLAMPLIAVLYAKKYGEDNTAKMFSEYMKGVAMGVSNIPFVGSVKDMVLEVNNKLNPDDPNYADKAGSLIMDTLSNQVSSRVPGFMINIAKLFDTKEREATGFVDILKSKLPILREGLKEKQDIFGQEILTESGLNQDGMDKYVAYLTQIMAGARIKTAKDTSYGKEIYRLKDTGNGVSLTSWKYRLGDRQERLKEKVGEDEYRRIYKEEYGKKMIEGINKNLSSEKYKKMSDIDKKKAIDNLNDDVIDSIYKKYKIPLRNKVK